MVKLKTSYVDDIIAPAMNGSRRYTQVTNDDGTISLIDTTTYSVVGSNFGAADINATNTQVNTMIFKQLTGKLTAGTETMTVNDTEITTSTLILGMFSSKYGVTPKELECQNGKIVAKFEKQDTDVNFIIRIQEVN